MADEYAREVAKIAVAQVADLIGYEHTHCNALEAVADVLVRYIRELGLYAKEYAGLQNRTDVCALDVVESIGDMGHICSDLYGFLQREPRDPFAQRVPCFPVYATAVQPPSFKSVGVKPPANVPEHLPAFPDPHTCVAKAATTDIVFVVECAALCTPLLQTRKAGLHGALPLVVVAPLDLIAGGDRGSNKDAPFESQSNSGLACHVRRSICCRHRSSDCPCSMKFTALLRNRSASVKQDHVELSRKRRQAEEALIKLHQKRVARSSTAKPNPFVAQQDLPQAEPLALTAPTAAADGVSSVRDAFQGLLDQEQSAHKQAGNDDEGARDVEMLKSDDDEEPRVVLDEPDREAWQTVVPATDALESDSTFKIGRIGFSLDMAAQLERLALKSRNAWNVEDAFEKNTQVNESGGRRRTSLFDTERMKKKRAQTILDVGPDAINMDDRHHDEDAF